MSIEISIFEAHTFMALTHELSRMSVETTQSHGSKLNRADPANLTDIHQRKFTVFDSPF